MISKKISNYLIILVFFLASASYAQLDLSQSCISPIARAPRLSQDCIKALKSSPKIAKDLPERISNWGSGGLGGQPWQFKSQLCQEQFISIFISLAKAQDYIKLSPHDLFHGHVALFGEDKEQLAILFHAKEYPYDLEKIKNYYQLDKEIFSSTDKEFVDRNFLFLSGSKKIYLIKNNNYCQEFFSKSQANTVLEEKIFDKLDGSKYFGDVNLFLPQNLGRIKYKFFSGLDFLGQKHKDLEKYLTGKSKAQRMAVNYQINRYLAKLKARPLLYFLSGEK